MEAPGASAETTIYDAVIVGAGIAGLSAAHRLRGRNILVLEAGDRPGGRIRSVPAGDYWLNFGAHMFGGRGTSVGDLVAELGLDSRPIRGALLGVSHAGKRLLRARAESFPFLLKMPLAARASFVRMGLALRLGSERMPGVLKQRSGEEPTERRLRVHGYENARTLSQMIGALHPDIAQFLEAFTERTGGSPGEMAAGYALRSFTNVWSRHSPGNNLFGGSSTLPEALGRVLGDRLQLGAQVSAVRPTGGLVLVDYSRQGSPHSVLARTVIVATPAYVTSRILRELPQATSDALYAVRYGAFLSLAVRTRETGAMPWDGNYAISTPGRSFSVLFNQATTLRTGPRQPGGSLMLFRGALGAARMMERTDAQIESAFLSDLVAEFPEAKGQIDYALVQRWPAGAPYSWPGRAALQPALTQPLGSIFLAGDYLEFPNMEAAAGTGLEAAENAEALLARGTARQGAG